MATSTAEALHSSDASSSAKNHALAPFRLVELIRYSGAPRHLRATLLAMLKAADNAGVVLWPAVKGIMIEGGVCRRTVQRNLLRLTKQDLLIRVHEPNEWLSEKHFRHTTTYRLNVHKLRSLRRPKEIHSSSWRTYREYKNATRSSRRRSAPASTHSSPASSPAAAQAPSLPQPHTAAAPVPVPAPSETSRVPRKLTPREGPKLVAKMVELMRGHTEHVQFDGYSFKLNPGDPRYRAPMPKENALIAASMALGIPHDAAEAHLKFCRWTFDDPEPSP